MLASGDDGTVTLCSLRTAPSRKLDAHILRIHEQEGGSRTCVTVFCALLRTCVCALLRSLSLFACICVLLRPTAFRTTTFGNCRKMGRKLEKTGDFSFCNFMGFVGKGENKSYKTQLERSESFENLWSILLSRKGIWTDLVTTLQPEIISK